MEHNPESLGINRTLATVLITVILLAIPFLGWLILMGKIVKTNKNVGGVLSPDGYIYKRCPNCSHIFEDNEHKFDEYREWDNHVCLICGQRSRILNTMLLGVYRHEVWTGITNNTII